MVLSLCDLASRASLFSGEFTQLTDRLFYISMRLFPSHGHGHHQRHPPVIAPLFFSPGCFLLLPILPPICQHLPSLSLSVVNLMYNRG